MKLKDGYISLLVLLFGTAIYLLFRTSSLRIFKWLDLLGMDIKSSTIRKKIISTKKDIPEWFIYSLPDGIWIFSYVTMILLIWNYRINKESFFWILVVPIIAVMSEFLQLYNVVSGTFDYLDIIFYLVGGVIPFFICRKKIIIDTL